MGRVIVLGSVNVDLEVRVPHHPKPGEKVIGETLQRFAGGKGANQAVAARAAGAEVYMVGAVGDDDAGRAALNRLYDRGIRLMVDRVSNTPTGHALITTDGGSNAIVVVPGANAHLGARVLDPIKGLGSGDLLLTQLETPVEQVSQAVRQAAQNGVRIMINLAPYAELPDDVVRLADPLVVPQAHLSQFEARGVRPRSMVILLGKTGVAWDDEIVNGEIVPESQVVDTLGASDALVGTMAAAIVAGKSHTDAMRAGLAAAAENVRHFGAHRYARIS